MKLPGQERLENLAATALRVWLIVGILLRVTRVRDRFDALALVFYTTPWPVIAVGLLLLALHGRRRGARHAARRYTAFTCGALFTWVATSWYSTPPTSETPELRIIHWNVGHPEGRLPRCARWLRAQDADIICLADSRAAHQLAPDRWGAEFPGYLSQEGPGTMHCLVRGEVLSRESGVLGIGSEFILHRLRVRGREVTLLQVDLYARPLQSRRPALARVAELVRQHAEGGLIIAGDFNTPRESALLDPLRAEFAHAFETRGRGFAETWPVPALALSIDQVWLGRRWKVVDCVQPWTALSDHRPVVVSLAGG